MEKGILLSKLIYPSFILKKKKKKKKKLPIYYLKLTLLRSGGNYHHIMFRNPTAAVNLFHIRKQYLSFCKAKATVTRNLIGRKIISNVKRSDTRNSLPTEAFVTEDWIGRKIFETSYDQVINATVRHSTASECYVKRQVSVIRVGAPSHLPMEYRHTAAVVSWEHRIKLVVFLGDGYQWPLHWECTLNS